MRSRSYSRSASRLSRSTRIRSSNPVRILGPIEPVQSSRGVFRWPIERESKRRFYDRPRVSESLVSSKLSMVCEREMSHRPILAIDIPMAVPGWKLFINGDCETRTESRKYLRVLSAEHVRLSEDNWRESCRWKASWLGIIVNLLSVAGV